MKCLSGTVQSMPWPYLEAINEGVVIFTTHSRSIHLHYYGVSRVQKASFREEGKGEERVRSKRKKGKNLKEVDTYTYEASN